MLYYMCSKKEIHKKKEEEKIMNDTLNTVLSNYEEIEVMVFNKSEKMLFKGNGQNLLSMLGAGYYADKKVKQIDEIVTDDGIILSVDIILK